MRPLLLTILVLPLLGCGQRGSLYLPEQRSSEAVNEPAAAEAPADETAPAEPGSPVGEAEEEDREGENRNGAGPADR
jgi:predicted small lipoprotein YifL